MDGLKIPRAHPNTLNDPLLTGKDSLLNDPLLTGKDSLLCKLLLKI